MKLAAVINIGNFEGIGNIGARPTSVGNAAARFADVVSLVIGVLTLVAGIWFIFQVFMGAFQWITAGSDKEGVQKAQKRFTNALVGLVVTLFSYTLIALVARTFGFDILNLETLITSNL